MGQFNTHGGYFSPKDYYRINEGGSHEENPNGGVQVGVDPNGVPNVLEENESVYDDYVFSDNIYADEKILEEMNLPKKYKGWLYSDIADDLIKEAEERPYDPVSNNGISVMFGRLAEAQETQKQREQEAELEKELSNLSPEEMEELNAMLAEQEAAGQEQMVQGEEVPQEVVPEMVQQPEEAGMPVPQMPVMANGGFIRTFEDGTPGRVIPFNVDPETGNVSGGTYMPGYDDGETLNLFGTIDPSVSVAFPGKSQAWVDAEVGPNSIKKKVAEGSNQFISDAADVLHEASLPIQLVMPEAMLADAVYEAATGDVKGAATDLALLKAGNLFKMAKKFKNADEAAKFIANSEDKVKNLKGLIEQWGANAKAAQKEIDAAKKAGKGFGSSGKSLSTLKSDRRAAKDMLSRYESELKTLVDDTERAKLYINDANNAGKTVADVAKKAEDAAKTVEEVKEKGKSAAYKVWDASRYLFDPTRAYRGWKDASILGKTGRLVAAQVPFGWEIPAAIKYGSQAVDNWKSAKESDSLVLEGENDPFNNVQFKCGGSMNKYDDGGLYDRQRKAMAQLMQSRQGVLPGISGYGIQPAQNFPMASSPTIDKAILFNQSRVPDIITPGLQKARDISIPAPHTASQAATASGFVPFKTGSQYAGAINAGLVGLYDVFQPLDKYQIGHIHPRETYTQQNYINPVYAPVDQNKTTNDIMNLASGTMSSLRQSVPATSAGQAMIAADYNLGRNVGAANSQDKLTNVQLLNAVLAGINQNVQARARLESAEAAQNAQRAMYADAHNISNDILRQEKYYASEGDKFGAIQNQLDLAGKFLSDIGNTNKNLNMIGTDGAFDYYLGPDGVVLKKPTGNVTAYGGFIKPFKAK